VRKRRESQVGSIEDDLARNYAEDMVVLIIMANHNQARFDQAIRLLLECFKLCEQRAAEFTNQGRCLSEDRGKDCLSITASGTIYEKP